MIDGTSQPCSVAPIDPLATVAVVTFTVNRPELLALAAKSVQRQLAGLRCRHCLFVPENVDAVIPKDVKSTAQVITYPSRGLPDYIPQRMAVLRNMAMDYVKEEYTCFLDDDNEYNPVHLASLHNRMRSEYLPCAHSLRYLVWPDGRFYRGDFYPWHPDPDCAQEAYEVCVRTGVIRPGDPVVYDGDLAGTVHTHTNPYATVDMNEWLFSTDFLKSVGFDTEFTNTDIAGNIGEDDKLLARVRRLNVPIRSTGLPTVMYRLGGGSNECNAHVRKMVHPGELPR